MHLALLAKAFDDLQVSVGASALDSEVHSRFSFLYGDEAIAAINAMENRLIPQNLALHFKKRKSHTLKNWAVSEDFRLPTRFTVEDGFGGPFRGYFLIYVF